ncbi:PDR/VanB family oxidoreductase [Paraburkholderia sp.]|uniref:PDR/VanB family oxidoreductase n=1 Tax=Paraburkholderia sp. TaxID=1926495 RepID=UPI0023922382|nr:PDR/VanB family oxidoreductase [Paraburkholderia sp.]MDE1180787.1 PDR/VanB family oxidoreductase [Paraburkholderia sp.]
MHEQTGGEVVSRVSTRIRARVRTIRHEAERVLSVELVPADGDTLPRFTPGAHIDLHLPNGITRSYSLVNSPDDVDRYVIAILADANSRGGSRYVHEQLRCGAIVPIGAPRNNFALDEDAASTVLVAGGIGITPMLCMFRRLREKGRDVRLIYCARDRSQAAFLDELDTRRGDVHLHFDAEHDGRPFDLAAMLAQQAPGVHAYCCGPNPMLTAFEIACENAGVGNVHIERFAASAPLADAQQGSYTVELAKSGRRLAVPAGAALLDVLLEAGVEVDYSCREGLCGACETRVLGGCPDHRDAVLTQSDKAANTVMMICVSGAKSGTLVLDLA